MQNSFFYPAFQKQSDEYQYPNGFIIPPLILPNTFQPPFPQPIKIENYTNQSFIDPSAFLNFQNQDAFFNNSDDKYNPNTFPAEYQNNDHLTNPEITIDSDFMTKSKEYAMDYFQTCRSKGPSFCLGKSKKENLDFFSPANDILSYFEQNESNNALATDSKTLESTADDFITTDRNNSPQRSSPRILPYDRRYSLDILSYPEMGSFPFENSISRHNSFDQSSLVRKDQTRPKNASLAVQKAKTTTRKKRKIEKNNDFWVKDENSETLPSNLKLTKSKSEFYNNSLDTVNMENSSCMPNMKNPFTLINDASLCGILQESTNQKQNIDPTICEKIEKDDKSTDISPSMSIQPKYEDSPQGFKFSLGILPSNNLAQTPKLPTCDFLTKIVDFEHQKENPSQGISNNKEHSLTVKRIGTLTVEERKAKIEKYLEKRKQRSWNKKISYDCRKRVADSRLRIKGRFVTKSQAFSILEADGVPYDPTTITMDEIKEYLTKKFGENHKIHDNVKRRYFEGEDSFIFEKRDENGDEEEEEAQENDRDFYFEMKEEFLLSPLRFSDGKVSFPYE